MSYYLSQKEMEAVSCLNAEARLNHFVKRVADWEEVWSLRNSEGWVLSQASPSQEAAPFWPHFSYAKACAKNEWAGCEPQSIKLQAFMEKWLPGLAKDKKMVAIFPTPISSGAIATPELVLQKLVAECRESYGDGL
jgi:hypothetical protein